MPNNLVLPSATKSSSRSSSKASRSRSSVPLSFGPAVAALTAGKASRVFAAFVSYHYLQDRVALPQYLFFVLLGAVATLLSLQQPWRGGKRIGAKRARRVLAAGGLLALTLYLWTAGLRSAGPLRTLLVDGAEVPLVYLFAVVSRREMPERRKTRGALFMLLAYALLVWDASGQVPDVKEIERSRLGRRAGAVVGEIANRSGVAGAGRWAAAKGRDGDEEAEEFNKDELGGGGGGGGGGDEFDSQQIQQQQQQQHHHHHHHHHHGQRQQRQQQQQKQAGGGGGGGVEIANDGSAGGGGVGARRRLLTTFRPPVKGSGRMGDALVEGTALRCEVGVILVLVASVLLQCGRGFSRRLSAELGGAKRHFALATTAAWGWIAPLALVSWASSSTGAVLSLQAIGGVSRMDVTWGHVVGFFAVGFLWLVLPYYVRAVVSTALPQRTLVQSGVVVPFVMACAASAVFGLAGAAGGVSWPLLAAFALECAGINLMMAGGVKRSLSELPIDGSGSTIGNGGSTAQGAGGGAAAGGGGQSGAAVDKGSSGDGR